MKTFAQLTEKHTDPDKIDKLKHPTKLDAKRLEQLKGDYTTYEDIAFEQWQGYPFPKNSSNQTFNELKTLISLGQFRSEWEEEMIMYDTKVLKPFKDYCESYGIDVDFTRIKSLMLQTNPILLALKAFYNRPRPAVLAKSLGLSMTFFPLKTSKTPSYPSGHATQGHLVSLLVADELPLEHRRNILKLGKRIGESRQIAGAHYPSDTKFGIELGDEFYRLSKTSAGQEPELKLESIISILKENDMINESSSKASTVFEAVIVKCHNYSTYSEKKFKDIIMKDPDVKAFLKAAKKPWATFGKTPEEQAKILYKFAKLCQKQFGSGKSDAGAGQSNKTTSAFWKRETEKVSDVSKTDILIAGKQASVKGPVAQLMSGKKPEVRATILSAAEASGRGDILRASLLAATDKFVETVSVGAEMTTANLRKLSNEKAIETGNAEAKKIVETQATLQAEVNKAFTDAFKDPKVAYEFAREAMTGTEKFSAKTVKQNNSPGDTTGEATHMLVWDYRMDRLMFKKIDASIVNHSSKSMNVNAGFKSNSQKKVAAKTPTNPKGKVGYSIFQTLRISTNQLLDQQGEFVQAAQEQISHAGNQLDEGVISEFDFKGMISKVWNWLKDKLKSLWNWFKEKIESLATQIRDLINNYSIGDVLHDFDGDVKVQFNNVIKFKVK